MARKTTCISNVKQLASAVMMYVQDYDETFPACSFDDNDGDAHPVVPGDFNSHHERQWFMDDLLGPYIKNDGMYRCPTLGWEIIRTDTAVVKNKVKDTGSYFWACGHFVADMDTPFFAMLYFAVLVGAINDPNPDPNNYFPCGRPMAALSRPAQKIILGCDSYGVHEGYSDDYIEQHFLPPPFGLGDTVGGSVVAFGDGHAKYIKAMFWGILEQIVNRN